MKSAIAKIFQEAQQQRTDTIVSIKIEVNGSQLKYAFTNLPASSVDDRLAAKVEGVIAMLDKETFDLLAVSKKFESNPNCQAFLVGLQVAENQFRIVWIFDADETSFCYTVEQIINQHFAPVGTSGKGLVNFAESISEEDVRLMSQAIDEECGKIDADEW